MDIEIIVVGVVIISGLAVVIFKRVGRWRKDDYGYTIPRTGTWGVGQRSEAGAMRDAEQAVASDMGED